MGGWPAGAAPPGAGCQVKNLSTRVNYGGGLQAAIDAAGNGDVIRVRGVCTGNFLIPGAGSVTDLTLAGQPGRRARSALDGNHSGTVLTIGFVTSTVHVTLRNLKITDGSTGIFNLGDLTLDGRTSVSDNAGNGIETPGILVMNDRSTVSGNKDTGIDDEGAVTLNDRSSVRGNTGQDGGGIFDDATFLALNDRSSVTGNTAQVGGGIFEVGTLTLSGRASVTHNTATKTGGGIVALSGVDACPSWTGAISPNSPDDTPAVTTVTCHRHVRGQGTTTMPRGTGPAHLDAFRLTSNEAA
jgi:hypothetical protein